jgi:hypothetical protein
MFLYYVPAASYPAMTEIAKAEWGENALVPYTAYITSTWIIFWPLIMLLYLLKGILHVIISSLLGLYSICRDGLNSFTKGVQKKIEGIKRN